jgi:hypothetical protein
MSAALFWVGPRLLVLYLARAVTNYRRLLRRNGLVEPDELAVIEAWLTTFAASGDGEDAPLSVAGLPVNEGVGQMRRSLDAGWAWQTEPWVMVEPPAAQRGRTP